MNGKLLLDTNAVIALLEGNATVENLCAKATWIGISVITELEFLSFDSLSASDVALFEEFKKRVEVISVNQSNITLLQMTIDLRRTYNVKLPDAIIAASAIINKANLVSNDAFFGRVTSLKTLTF